MSKGLRTFLLTSLATLCALHTGWFVASGSPWSAAGAVFSGIFAIYNAVALALEDSE